MLWIPYMEKRILKTLNEVKDWFKDRTDLMSFDWETTGLDYMTMEPVGVSFCDGKRTCYIDLWENEDAKEILEYLGTCFSTGTYIAHNAKFDIKCCRKFIGQYPVNIFCTFIASYLLDENRRSHSLKVIVTEDLGIDPKEVEKWEHANNSGYHSEKWYRYCFNDSIWAFRLYDLYRTALEGEGLEYLFYNIEMPFQFVAADIEINGVLVDRQELEQLELRTRNKIVELEDRMFASIGMSVIIQNRLFGDGVDRILPINLRSGLALKKVLKKHCGIVVKDVKKQTIEGLKGKHPFIDFLLQYKAVRKLYDGYIKPVFKQIDSDGRIRPSVGIVKTGRTSFRRPNLQQLPNLHRTPGLNYRAIFIAPEGMSLVGGDYSGQELRVLGEVSEDSTIIHSFLNGLDLHLVTANFIFNLGLNEKALTDGTEEHESATKKFKIERYKAKNGVNFPIVYGTSEYGISFRQGVPVTTAKEWIRAFFELYPGVKEAMEDTRTELENNQEVRTMMGRKRRFPDYKELPKFARGKEPNKSRCVRQAFNFKIQGFSADQVKIASVRARSMELKIIMIVHDEIVIESDNPTRDVRILKGCMEQAVSLSIPFVADVKTGKRYSEVK